MAAENPHQCGIYHCQRGKRALALAILRPRRPTA